MPLNPNAAIEITAFNWVPEFARGLVRDLRVRWALEEAGLDYRVRLLDAMSERPANYYREQPFGQVPIFNDGKVRIFETGAIVLHIGAHCETLLPREIAKRARATSWVIAALNTVEPLIMDLAIIDLSNPDEDWAKQRRPEAERMVKQRLARVSDWLGDRHWLEDRFSAGDLMMSAVLRILRHTELVAGFPNLAEFKARCEARPAFQRALAAQLADFEQRDAVAAG